MGKLVENLKYAALFIVGGFLLAVGTRAGQWLIPAPEDRIIVCTASDTWKVETCIKAQQIVAGDKGDKTGR